MPLHLLNPFLDSIQYFADPVEDPVDPFEDPVDPFEDPTDPFEDPVDPFADPVDPFAVPVDFVDSIPNRILHTLSNMDDPSQRRNWKYKDLRQAGEYLQRCMKYPNFPCHISRSQVSIRDLKRQGWNVESTPTCLPPAQREHAVALGYPDSNKGYRMTLLEKMVRRYDEGHWHGRIAEGVIFIENIERMSVNAAGPWTSELSRAVYARRFPMETLRHVFVCNVVNEQTYPFLRHLYRVRRPGTWKDGQVAIWEETDGDFQALLGTRIGRVVAYMVLGAFDRGTRRIVRIATWHSFGGVHMRFDLE